MPGTGKYTTFDPATSKDPAVGDGKSNLTALKTIFKTSPLNKGEDFNRKLANSLGEKFLTPPSVDDGGYMYGKVDLDYTKAPDLSKVVTGGGGLPSTPYTANLNSPGEGNGDNPKSVTAMDKDAVPKPNLGYDPAGEGTASPSTTSKQVSATTLGAALTPGKRPGAV